MLEAPELLALFEGDRPLPPNYGIGLSERVVEYPWIFAKRPAGSILDAGSTLNHKPILERVLHEARSLHIVTLAPERRSFTGLGVSYVFADIRKLPYADATFDTVVCISTLEHVGMDNRRYGGPTAEATDHTLARACALSELIRVARPGGRILVTVPYGRPDDFGWMHVLGRDDVERIAAAASEADVAVFAYSIDGWNPSSLDDAADAIYRRRETDPHPADLAVTARAVACIELRVPRHQPGRESSEAPTRPPG